MILKPEGTYRCRQEHAIKAGSGNERVEKKRRDTVPFSIVHYFDGQYNSVKSHPSYQAYTEYHANEKQCRPYVAGRLPPEPNVPSKTLRVKNETLTENS